MRTYTNLLRLTSVLVGVLLCLLIVGSPVTADVTCDHTIADSDTAALILALEDANLDPTLTTICLTQDSTYTLTEINNSINGDNGLPVINSEVVIEGNNATITRDENAPEFRLIEVAETNGDLTLDSVTLSNGRYSKNASAILSRGSLAIHDSRIENNTGARWVVSDVYDTLEISLTTFANNSGCALRLSNYTTPATVTDSTFEFNDSTADGYEVVCAAIAVSGIASITDSTFRNNTSYHGGALYLGYQGDQDIIIENNTFQNNNALTGGAIRIDNARVAIVNTRFYGNSAQVGGAIAVLGSSAFINITDSIFDDNNATTIGGMWYSSGVAGNISVENSCFTNNTPEMHHPRHSGQAMFIGRDNWWGAVNGPSGLGTGSGEFVSENVVYEPFLTEPPFPECFVFDPVAGDQTVDVLYETPQEITVTAHGGLPPYTFQNVSQPTHGTVTGTVPDLIYTPDEGFGGIDSFTFEVAGYDGEVFTGTVTLDMYSDVDANDQEISARYSPDGIPITFSATGSAPPFTYTFPDHETQGTITGTPPNITYIPPAAFEGQDTILFRVTDEGGFTDIGYITLDVTWDLEATDSTVNAAYNTAASVLLSATLGEPPYTFDEISPSSHGTLSGTAPDLTYTPDNDFVGEDSFTFVVTDAYGFSRSGTISILVANDLVHNQNNHHVQSGEAYTFDLSYEGGLAPFNETIIAEPAHGTLTEINGTYTYIMDTNHTGLDSVTFTVTDANGDSIDILVQFSTAEVLSVDPVDVLVPYETSFLIPLSATGGTPPYTFDIYEGPYNGIISGNAPNFIYTPNDGYDGMDWFYYRVIDADDYWVEGLASVTVAEPFTVTESVEAFTDFGTEVSFFVSYYGGSEPFEYEITTPPADGIVESSGFLGYAPWIYFYYTPDETFGGEDTIVVTFTDNFGTTRTTTLTAQVGVPLTAEDQSFDINYEQPATVVISHNDGNAPFAYSVTTSPEHGTLSGDAPDLTYTPDTGFAGTDSFVIEITDQSGTIVSKTVTINVSVPITVSAGDVNGLVDAINTANSNTIPDTILLETGVYLFDADFTNWSSNAFLPDITGELVIRGNNATLERADDAVVRRRFIYNSGHLTISDLTFSHGIVQGSNYRGGAISNQTSLTLIRTHFLNNTSVDSYGGAINSAGTLHISASSFEGNSARLRGSAIHAEAFSTITIADSTFSNNSGVDETTIATVISAEDVTITNSIFENNSTQTATIVAAYTLHITDSTFRNNTNVGAVVEVSAIWRNSRYIGDATIIGSVFENNTTRYGAIHVTNRADATIEDSIIINNVGGELGSALQVAPPRYGDGANATVRNSCIVGNSDPAVVNNTRNQSISLQYNWWGAADGPNYGDNPGHGDSVQIVLEDDVYRPSVSTTPHLTEPLPGCPVLPPIVSAEPVDVTQDTGIEFTLPIVGGLPPYIFNEIGTPAHGTLTGTAPDMTYTPSAGYSGEDSFTITVTNASGESTTGVVNLVVHPLLTPYMQTVETTMNLPIAFALETPTGTPPFNYALANVTPNGVLWGDAPEITYLPNQGFIGTDTFTYTLIDANGESVTNTVTVNINEAQPATITVDTLLVEVPVDNGNCSLHEAILAANRDSAVDNCPTGNGADIIQLPAGTFSMDDSTGYMPHIQSEIILRGAGMDVTIIDGNYNDVRLIGVQRTGNIQLQDLTLQGGGGFTYSRGGAIYSDGDVSLINVRLTHNRANNSGGGVYIREGSVDVVNSAFEYNYGSFNGGAFYVAEDATLNVQHSAFQNNAASTGNAIRAIGSKVQINHSCLLTINDLAGIDGDSHMTSQHDVAGGNNYVDATYNWWGAGMQSPRASDAYTEPVLNVRPASCNLMQVPDLNVADGDVEGLISAIEYANSLNEGVVNLAENGTYVFDGTQIFDDNFAGNRVLPDIFRDVTINGNNATLRINDVDDVNFIYVHTNAHLTVHNMTFDGGTSITPHDGGAIHVFRSELVVDNVRFLNNTVDGGHADGGAIYGYMAVITVRNSWFEGNSASSGDAIYTNRSSITLTDNVFIDNFNRVTGDGNTILFYANEAETVNNNCFVNNDGLVLFQYANNAQLTATNNWWGATNGPSGAGSGDGDAIGEDILYEPFLTTVPAGCPVPALEAIDQTLEMPFFDNNIAIALSAVGGIPPYAFNITSNPANGILNGTAPQLTYAPDENFTGTDSFTFEVIDQQNTVTMGTITVNVLGGNIVVDSIAQETPFIDNGNCTLGEAIHAANTDSVVDGCTSGNGTDVITLAQDATYTLSVVDNTSSQGENGLPRITSSIIINGNNATIERGDGAEVPDFRMVFVEFGGDLTLNDATLRNGRLSADDDYASYGGAIRSHGDLTLSNMSFDSNYAYRRGGAVYVAEDGGDIYATIHSSTFTNNAVYHAGGALALCTSGQIIDSHFSGNTAIAGGAIRNACETLTITDSVFEENTAQYGGAIYNWRVDTHLSVMNSQFTNNQATSSGSAIYNEVVTYEQPSTVAVSESCFYNTGTTFAVINSLDRPDRFDATNNWWGSTTGPGGVGSGEGTRISDTSVVFEPFYTTPLPGCDIFPPQGNRVDVYTAFNTPVELTEQPTAFDGAPPYTFSIQQPTYGQITGEFPDTVIYTPPVDLDQPSVTISVSITDSENRTELHPMTYVVHVAPPLVATDQTVDTTYMQSRPFSLDVHGGREPYDFGEISQPTNGTISGTAPNLTYTPDPGFSGTETVTYTLTDENGTPATATLTINVGDPVTSVDMTVSTFENTAVSIMLYAEAGTVPYTFSVNNDAHHGNVIHLGDDRVIYVPDVGFTGTDSFTYLVRDDNSDVFTSTVTINISTNILNVGDGDIDRLISVINNANASGVPVAINLTPDSPYTIPTGVAPFTISGDIIINGNGATISREDDLRVFNVATGGYLAINHLNLENGISNNSGELLFNNSTFANVNTSVMVLTGGDTQGINSTISGNVGGIVIEAGTLSLTNVTLADNQAGAINNIGGTVLVTNSILDNNLPQNCFGTVESGGNNVVSDDSCGFDVTEDLIDVDPQIEPLANNGGPTRTHALNVNSVARNQANPAVCAQSDQRGAVRTNCDIGAFEIATVPIVDLGVDYTLNTTNVVRSLPFDFSVSVTNYGSAMATNVMVSVGLPPTLTYVASSPEVCEYIEHTLICNPGTLTSGASMSITIQTTTNADADGTLPITLAVNSVEDDVTITNNATTIDIVVETESIVQIAPLVTSTSLYGNPIYSWSDTSVDSYELYITRMDGLQIVNPTLSREGICDGSLCQIDLTSVDDTYRIANGAHQWYVREVGGPWVGPMDFTLNTPSPGLVALATTTETNTAFPTFNWALSGDATNATRFALYIADDNNRVILHEWFTRTSACGSPTATTCALRSPVSLTHGTTYSLYILSEGPGGLSVGGPIGNGYQGIETFTVTLPVPAQVSLNDTITASNGNIPFQWTGVDGSTVYELYINRDGAQFFYQQVNCATENCNFDLTSASSGYFMSNATYDWWVRAQYGDDTWSPWVGSTQVIVNVPAPPMVTPGNIVDVDTARPTFNWTVPQGANINHFQLYMAGSDGTVVMDTTHWYSRADTCGSVDAVNCAFESPVALADGVEYTLYIQSYGPGGVSTGGVYGGYAEFVPFTVDVPKPVLVAPSANAILTDNTLHGHGDFAFAWTGVENALGYELYVTFNGAVFFYDAVPCASNTNCSIDLTTISEDYRMTNGAYTWYMRAQYADSSWSPWADPMNFTLAVDPPALVSPLTATNINTYTPTFNWSLADTATNATWFNLYLAGSDGAVPINGWYSRTDTCGSVDAVSCAFTSPVALADGVQYTLYIQSYGPGGISTGGEFDNGYVSFAPFTVTVPKPVLGTPNTTITNGFGDPDFTWTGVAGAIGYELYVARNGALFFYALVTCGTEPNCSVNLVEISENYRLTNGSYSWYVRAQYADTSWSPWAGQVNFTVSVPPAALVTPADTTNPTSLRPTFNWILAGSAATDTMYFQLVIGVSDGTTLLDTTTWTIHSDLCGTMNGTNCAFTPGFDLTPGLDYTLYVQSYSIGGISTGGAFGNGYVAVGTVTPAP